MPIGADAFAAGVQKDLAEKALITKGVGLN